MNIDLNSDLGEGFGLWKMGDDEELMKIVSSANIACGGHAGDYSTMHNAIVSATRENVVIGAHPGFEDRQGFGRRRIALTTAEISQLVAGQVGALMGIAATNGAQVSYVKPHGALGNWAAENAEVATAITNSVMAVMGSQAAILAISGTILEKVALSKRVRVYSEIFADRGYTPEGNLVPRSEPGALIHDAKEVSERLVKFLETRLMPTVNGDAVELNAHSICIHGDTPGALGTARKLRKDLEKCGFKIESFINGG